MNKKIRTRAFVKKSHFIYIYTTITTTYKLYIDYFIMKKISSMYFVGILLKETSNIYIHNKENSNNKIRECFYPNRLEF